MSAAAQTAIPPVEFPHEHDAYNTSTTTTLVVMNPAPDPQLAKQPPESRFLGQQSAQLGFGYDHAETFQPNEQQPSVETSFRSLSVDRSERNHEASVDPTDDPYNDEAFFARDTDTPNAKPESKFLREDQKKRFTEWITTHSENLYPSRDEKLSLARELNATYLQVTRLLANHRRRLQLQKKRKPTGGAEDDVHSSSGDKENRLSALPSETGQQPSTTSTNTHPAIPIDEDSLVMSCVRSVVDGMSHREPPNRLSSGANEQQMSTASIVPAPTADEETRMSHFSQLHCDESFDDLEDPDDHPASRAPTQNIPHNPSALGKSSAEDERKQRIDFVIDEVVQYVSQLPPTGTIPSRKDANYVTPPPSAQPPVLPGDVGSAPMNGATNLATLQQQHSHSMPNGNNSDASANSMLRQQQENSSFAALNGSHFPVSTPQSVDQLAGTQNIPPPQQQQDQPTSSTSYHQQQQAIYNALGSLSLSNFVPHEHQTQAGQAASSQAQSAPSLLPLLQRLLSGDLVNGRGEEKIPQEQVPNVSNAPAVSRAYPPTGTSLALNQLIGNNSCSSSSANPQPQHFSPQPQSSSVIAQSAETSSSSSCANPTDRSTTSAAAAQMLYSAATSNSSPFQSTLNAFAASLQGQQQNPAAPLMSPSQLAVAQSQQQQQQSVADFVQQMLQLRQQQQVQAAASASPYLPSSLLALIQQQQQQQFAKLAGVQNASGGCTTSTPLLTPDHLLAAANGMNCMGSGVEKTYPSGLIANGHPTTAGSAQQSASELIMMSPPLSSHASSSSPLVFSNSSNDDQHAAVQRPPLVDTTAAFSDISSNCSLSPTPLRADFPTTIGIHSSTLITPPSTGGKKPRARKSQTADKPPRKTKKQLRAEQQGNENLTPVSRKRTTTSGTKRETAKEKRARLCAEMEAAERLQKTDSPPVVPRQINELTENESIAVAVLAGLANGRFP